MIRGKELEQIYYKGIPLINILIVCIIFLEDLIKQSNTNVTLEGILYLITLAVIASLAFVVEGKKCIMKRFIALGAIILLHNLSYSKVIYFLYYIQLISVALNWNKLRMIYLYAFIATICFDFVYLTKNMFLEVWSVLLVILIINFASVYVFYISRLSWEKIKENNIIFSSILDKTSNGFHFIDLEGRTRLINQAAINIVNANSTEEFLGKYDWDIFFDGNKYDERGNLTSSISETLINGKEYKNFHKEFTNTKTGITSLFSIETFRIYDDHGKFLGAMGVYNDITEQSENQRQLLDAHYELANMAVTDGLTKLYNYRYFRQRLNEETAKAYNSTLSLLIIDVDYFKIYNDLFGHLSGDKALQKIARILKNSVRDSELVARYGGEEFTIVLPGIEKSKAVEIAERIRITINDSNFAGEEKLPFEKLTVTIGVATIPDDAQTSEELIEKADEALYDGKNRNRNVVSF